MEVIQTYKAILKIDLDIKMKKKWLKLWEKSREGLLNSIGIKLEKIIMAKSSKRGYHYWIWIESPKELDSNEINHLQMICGDDLGRVLIAARRIKRGIKNWNKIFDHTVFRRSHNCNCSIHQKIIKRMKEGQEIFKGI